MKLKSNWTFQQKRVMYFIIEGQNHSKHSFPPPHFMLPGKLKRFLRSCIHGSIKFVHKEEADGKRRAGRRMESEGAWRRSWEDGLQILQSNLMGGFTWTFMKLTFRQFQVAPVSWPAFLRALVPLEVLLVLGEGRKPLTSVASHRHRPNSKHSIRGELILGLDLIIYSSIIKVCIYISTQPSHIFSSG